MEDTCAWRKWPYVRDMIRLVWFMHETKPLIVIIIGSHLFSALFILLFLPPLWSTRGKSHRRENTLKWIVWVCDWCVQFFAWVDTWLKTFCALKQHHFFETTANEKRQRYRIEGTGIYIASKKDITYCLSHPKDEEKKFHAHMRMCCACILPLERKSLALNWS